MKKSLALGGRKNDFNHVNWFRKCREHRKEQSPENVPVRVSCFTADNQFTPSGYAFWPLLLKMIQETYLNSRYSCSPVNKVTYVQRDRDTELQSLRDSEVLREGDSEATDATEDSALGASVKTLQDAVNVALRDGWSNEVIFRYCRSLRAFERNVGIKLSLKEQKNAFSLLWPTVHKNDPDGTHLEWESDFLLTFPKVRIAIGASALADAIKAVDDSPLPAMFDTYEPRIARLLAVCWHLSARGTATFFISVRDVAKIIETPSLYRASAILNRFVLDGLIKQAEKSTRRKAARYVFVNNPSPTPD